MKFCGSVIKCSTIMMKYLKLISKRKIHFHFRYYNWISFDMLVKILGNNSKKRASSRKEEAAGGPSAKSKHSPGKQLSWLALASELCDLEQGPAPLWVSALANIRYKEKRNRTTATTKATGWSQKKPPFLSFMIIPLKNLFPARSLQ